jgi:hypothetical protein
MEHISPLLQALIDNLGESAAVCVLAALGFSWKSIQNWWKDRAIRAFERGINQNVRLRELLSELRVPYSADRVRLYQFHNGEYYHSGESIMKCSLTHYVTRIGVANPPAGLGIPTTQMVMSLKLLQDNASVELLPDTFDDDSLQDSIFVETGAQLALASVVRNSRSNWIGILVVCWMNKPKTADPEQLKNYAKLIGQFLSQRS